MGWTGREFFTMKDIIKFVGAAINPKALQPHMHNFLIDGGRLSATNGNITISALFPLDITCAPHAESFKRAIAACEGSITMTLERSRLVVRSGKFRSVVPCADVSTWKAPDISGEIVAIESDLSQALEKLLPFISKDESRPWSNGILLKGNSAFATNSITLVEHHLSNAFPVVANLPIEAVREMVRLKVQPESVQAENHQLTFHLPGAGRITCKTLASQWPETQGILAKTENYKGNFISGKELESVLEDVSTLHRFDSDNGLVYFNNKGIWIGSFDEATTEIENENITEVAAFKSAQLIAMKGIAEKVGFEAYPEPVPFFAKNLRGVLSCFRV